jgi:hypothetical protein
VARSSSIADCHLKLGRGHGEKRAWRRADFAKRNPKDWRRADSAKRNPKA